MKTWRKKTGHHGQTYKPGLIPIEATRDIDSPEARKEIKKRHNRKSRHFLNKIEFLK